MCETRKELLVIRVNVFFNGKDFDHIVNFIQMQRQTGTIVLPPYCEALVVPADAEIKIEGPNGKELENGGHL